MLASGPGTRAYRFSLEGDPFVSAIGHVVLATRASGDGVDLLRNRDAVEDARTQRAVPVRATMPRQATGAARTASSS